jgi:hypothetical protein
MNKTKQVFKTSEFAEWNYGSDGKKTKKSAFAKQKFHTFPIFREHFLDVLQHTNAFCETLFNVYINSDSKNIISSIL